jgi:AraC-like DNA-binding protein
VNSVAESWNTTPLRSSFRAEWVLDLLEVLASFTDVEPLCLELGFARVELRTAALRVPRDIVFRILDGAAKTSGDRLLGLHLVSKLRARSVLAYLVSCQETVREAIAQLLRYQHLLLGGPALIVVERGSSWMLLQVPDARSDQSRHFTEYFMARLYTEGQHSAGSRARLQEVRFRHAAAAAVTEYRRLFNCPVQFDQTEDAVLIPRETLDRGLRGRNSFVAGLIERTARAQADIVGDVGFRDRVELVVRSNLLSAVACKRVDVAHGLAVSPATLQRRLWAEGTSFRQVKAAVQRQAAQALLGLPTLSIDEIAARCGFATAQELNVAFKDWTGRSPATYRARLRRQRGARRHSP